MHSPTARMARESRQKHSAPISHQSEGTMRFIHGGVSLNHGGGRVWLGVSSGCGSGGGEVSEISKSMMADGIDVCAG